MGVEIERKFLVSAIPAPLEGGVVIEQGYLAFAKRGEGSEVRLRNQGGVKVQTVKSAGGLVRGEVNVVISDEQFDLLWPLTVGARIAKTRYPYPLGNDGFPGLTAEIDKFSSEHLDGLVLVEVEFGSEGEAGDFTAPDWFGLEVTEYAFFKNARLARMETSVVNNMGWSMPEDGSSVIITPPVPFVGAS